MKSSILEESWVFWVQLSADIVDFSTQFAYRQREY